MGWDQLSQHLSQQLATGVFSFHIHDGDLWMFILFDKGEQVAQFNPLPDYWEELEPEERARWKGDSVAVSRCLPGVAAETIQNYFVEWTDDILSGEQKAYPDDRFPYGVDWQMTDFMRRVGLNYPVRDDGTTDGHTYRLRVRRLGGK